MANNLAAFTPKKYSLKLISKLWNETLYSKITNTDYEGEIKDSGDRVVVRTEQDITLSTYTKGMTLVAQDLTPTSEEMIVDQQKYFKFVVDDIDKMQNDIKTIDRHAENGRKQMSKTIDTDIFTYMYKQVLGDNAVGTNYSTGTVTVTTGTGAVVGVGTTFTSAMVGMPFKATGHTTYYTISAFTSTTAITIIDQDGIAYTGGAIGGGTAYTIKAASAVALTKSTLYAYLCTLGEVLDTSLCPQEGRWIVFNGKVKSIARQMPEFIPAVNMAYENVVISAKIGEIAGFQVYQSELIDGNNTTGYFIPCGDKGFVSFAMQVMKTAIVPSENDPNTFVNTCKGLLVWGRKVFAGTRGRGAFLRATFS